MKLLIVESPTKAKTINRYLGKEYKVISSNGHVRALPSTTGSVNTEKDFEMHFEIIPRAEKQVKEITSLVKQASEILLATDPDREGESISWHIFELIKKSIKANISVKRVVFHEITQNAIKKAIANSRTIDMELVHAQQARQALDYLVGFTLSPVLWRKLPGSKSAGRVQSVVLRIIGDREEEIALFKPQDYWSIIGKFAPLDNIKSVFEAQLVRYEGEKLEKLSISSEDSATKIQSILLKEKYHIAEIKRREIRRHPAPPFTTSSLLQEASKNLGLTAKQVSSVAQKLYEGIDVGENNPTGLITYMRTDSVYVGEEFINTTRNLIQEKFGTNYIPKTKRIHKNKAKNIQEAHEAIRPTLVTRTPQPIRDYLDENQFKVYNLIWNRMVSSQMSSAIFDNTTLIINSGDNLHSFQANGSIRKFDGYLKLLNENNKDQLLPDLKQKEKLHTNAIETNAHTTKPPPRYAESSLVKKMEELGIGRPSTYATVIGILLDREYVKKIQKRFVAEPRGLIVNTFLKSFFDKYVEYDFTAKLENDLDVIAAGKSTFLNLLNSFWPAFESLTEKMLNTQNTSIKEVLEKKLKFFLKAHNIDEKCQKCGGTLSLLTGKFGAFIGCSNYPECKNIIKVDSLNNSENKENTETIKKEAEVLSTDSESGETITKRNGPYGEYLQLGEGKKVKRVSLRDITEPITLEVAAKLLSLPITLGDFEGKEILLGLGKFGPYLKYGDKYISIKKQDSWYNTDLEKAINILKIG